MQIDEVLLPGVGIRYEFATAAGRGLVVVVHRDGRADISSYEARDPDRAHSTLELSQQEADALAGLLGSPRMSQRLVDLSREVPGLHSARLTVPDDSAFAGQSLGDTRARTLTGCSIVAVVRGHDVVAAFGPEQPLAGGDILVAIGSESGLGELAAILSNSG